MVVGFWANAFEVSAAPRTVFEIAPESWAAHYSRPMHPILLLSSSIGMGTLSGVSLYLATCLAGMAIRFDLIRVHDNLQNLECLANPWMIGISGTLCAVEMLADKIPGLDSLWDAIHTFIRPIGAIALALGSLGTVSTEWSVVAALLAGTASVTTHAAKMGTRMVANASPEPFSNIVLSITEDATVAAGTVMLLKYPYFTAGVCLITIVGLWILIPKLFRKIGGFCRVIKNRLFRPFTPGSQARP
jgi:hypothetical protein